MTRARCALVLAATLTVIASFAAHVQEQDKSERREKLRKAAGAAVEAATQITEEAIREDAVGGRTG